MEDREELDRSGAYDYESLLDKNRKAPPEESLNPSGLGKAECDAEEKEAVGAECESGATLEDWLLEETKPGAGIPGFEGEEDGGS